MATNLVASGSSGAQVFVRDRVFARTDLVSLAAGSDQTQSNGDSHLPSISADGHSVAFESAALDLSFKPPAAGRTFLVEVLATDDAGDEQIEPAGPLTVTR